jgi:hypothetical protein
MSLTEFTFSRAASQRIRDEASKTGINPAIIVERLIPILFHEWGASRQIIQGFRGYSEIGANDNSVLRCAFNTDGQIDPELAKDKFKQWWEKDGSILPCGEVICTLDRE